MVIARGGVMDIYGNPVAGVELGSRGDQLKTRSDAEGRFEMNCSGSVRFFVLEVQDARWASVRDAAIDTSLPDREHVIITAPLTEIVGMVVEDGGDVIEDALIFLSLHRELLLACPVPLDATETPSYETHTDRHGHFRLNRAPDVPGARLWASAPGYRSGSVSVTGSRASDILLVLEADNRSESGIDGIVLLPDLTPAEGARVRLLSESVTTDVSGHFRLERPRRLPEDAILVATQSGFQAAVYPAFGEFCRVAQDYDLRSITLVLGGPALTIAGRVIDAAGSPLAGWHVSILDGTEISWEKGLPLLAEHLVSGDEAAMTGVDGRFSVGGLFARAYMLRALDMKSLLSERGGPFPAGSQDVVISLSQDAVYPRVAGQVVSRLGHPVGGARVTLGFVTSTAAEGGTAWIAGASTITDGEGRFELASVPRTGVHLDVTGDVVMPERFDLNPDGEHEKLRLSVALRCHIRVIPDRAPPPASRIEVCDATGAPLQIYVFENNVWSASHAWAIDEEGSGVVSVSEDATTLRVFGGWSADAEVLAEVPVTLDPRQVTEVHVAIR